MDLRAGSSAPIAAKKCSSHRTMDCPRIGMSATSNLGRKDSSQITSLDRRLLMISMMELNYLAQCAMDLRPVITTRKDLQK